MNKVSISHPDWDKKDTSDLSKTVTSTALISIFFRFFIPMFLTWIILALVGNLFGYFIPQYAAHPWSFLFLVAFVYFFLQGIFRAK